MDEAEFLKRYDASPYERPSVAVDLVLMSLAGDSLAALLMRRDEHPFLDSADDVQRRRQVSTATARRVTT